MLLSISILLFTVLPPLVDFGETHVLHPDWPAHARFHMVSLVIENSLLGIFALFLIWVIDSRESVFIGGTISVAVFGGFVLAFLTTSFYSGALSDPEGVPPGPGGIDVNLLIFGLGFLMALAGLGMAYRIREPHVAPV